MYKLQFYGDVSPTALTPFGSYVINPIQNGWLLRFPDQTCREFSSEASARYYAQNHWFNSLAACMAQPLLTLFLTPGIWRPGVMDKTYTLHQLIDKYSLCEGIAVCYSREQKEIQKLIKDEVKISLTEFSNKGRAEIVSVLQKLAI